MPQGQAALEQAVAFAPDNFWYSQGLVSLYQQQNELDKAVTLLEKMVTRFPSKQEPLFSLLNIYSRQEKYNDVISQYHLITHIHRIFTVARRSIMMSFLH